MRITNQMLHASALRSLAANVAALQQIQEQVATGRRLVRPSDDPAQVRAAVKLRDGIAEVDQYVRNIDAADRTVSAADAALGSASEILQRARELAIQGANDTFAASDRQKMASEVEQLAAQLVQLAAAKVGEQYLFSGFQTDTAPYDPPAAGSAAVGPFLGDGGAILARIGPGTALQVNVTADAVFGPALDALAQMHAELLAGSRVSAGTIGLIDAGQDALIAGRTAIGSRANRLEQTRISLEEMQLAARRLLSELEDVDMARAISELMQRQTTYQAALAVNARILQRSLIDELR